MSKVPLHVDAVPKSKVGKKFSLGIMMRGSEFREHLRFRGGLVAKAHRRVHHSTLGKRNKEEEE